VLQPGALLHSLTHSPVHDAAFDKADLLYLRDQAEIERHKELELRDNERAQFEAMRAQTEAVGSGPLLTSALPPPRKSNTAAPAAGAPGGKPG
jgi:hypothetical protein